MAVIESVYARQILDSRGNPTVEVVLDTDDGAQGLGLVPSGASTGEAEAWERRDGDKSVYQGKGVLNAVKAVNEEIAPKVIGMDASDQRALDETMIELDGTPNKGRLGANAILGVSLAALYASAESADQPLYRYIGGTNGHILPVPNMNIMNGGAHADFATDIQEYMISPYGFNTYSEALQAGVEVYHTLKNVLKKQGLNTGLGDEGGFAPKMKSNKDSLNYIMDAISAAGYEPGKQIGISLDVASSEFYNKETGKYHFEGDDREAGYMLDFYENLINEYPIVSIEDPFQEEGWDDWAAITAKLGDRLQFVGDDLLVTNPARLAKGIKLGAANSLLVKLNQIGTVTETLDTIEMAKQAAYTTVVSHRSGETEDSFIADLSVAVNAGQIKTGSLCRSDRLAKYNQLLRIEEELEDMAIYYGPVMAGQWYEEEPEGDWDGWKKLTVELGERIQLVGDDIFVTNPDILDEGISQGVANSILIKLNQIGTVTETLDTIEMAKQAAYTTVISHRSGETEDSFIADLAVAVNSGQIKTGSLCRSDRLAKYNQLLRIEEELEDSAIYYGPVMAGQWYEEEPETEEE